MLTYSDPADPMQWTDEDIAMYEAYSAHKCVYQETPDGWGCVQCLYS